MRYVKYEGLDIARMEPEFQTITFDLEKYDNKEDAKRDIMELITIALYQGYEMRVRAEDKDIIIVEFNWDNSCTSFDMGNDRLMWVSSEEAELLDDLRHERAAQNARGDRDDKDNSN